MHRRARISATGGALLVAVALASVLVGISAPQGADLRAVAETTPVSTAGPGAMASPSATPTPAPIVRDDYTVTVTTTTAPAVSPGTAGSPAASDTEPPTTAPPTTALPECAAGEEAIPQGEEGYDCGPADLADPNTTGQPSVAPEPAPAGGGYGVPSGTVLTVLNGDQIITTPGAVLDGLDIHGRVIVKAPNVTIRNSIVRGADTGSKHGLVDALAGAAGLRIIDTEIAAAVPNYYVNGIMGYNFELRRVNIHSVIDQVHLTGGNVTIADSWLHDNLHFSPDPNHADNKSHDDNIQIQAGDNITIVNNILSGSHTAAVIITQGMGKVSNVLLQGNRVDDGGCSVNIAENAHGPLAGISIIDNTFGLTMKFARCAVVVKSAGTTPLLGGNVFSDGKPITITRH
ncbi:MAG TPA: hypothetical protein VIL55_00625 [Naasia sp.]